jgi:hypothetical protein
MTPQPYVDTPAADGLPSPLAASCLFLPSPTSRDRFDCEALFEPLTPTEPDENPPNNEDHIDLDYSDSPSEDDSILSTPTELSESGSFGDGEEVDVAVDSYAWRVDHSQGHHKLYGGLVHWLAEGD